MKTSEQYALVERYVAAYNAFDVEGMIAPLHEDVVFRNIANGEVTHETTGVAAFREQAKAATALFTTRRQRIVDWTPVGDEGSPGLIVGIDYHAVLAADLPNGMKAGEAISLSAKSEFRFRDGSIVAIVDRA